MKKILLAFLLLTAVWGFGQEKRVQEKFTDPNLGKEMILPPDVMAFQKYNFIQPDLFTGKINVQIPIYEITTGNITVPITISYNAGGIKVDDIASSVGLGWNLNAGGSIVRNVKDVDDRLMFEREQGYPDDWEPNQGTIIHVVEFAGRFHMNGMSSVDFTDSLESVQVSEFDEVYKADSQPDIYMVNAPGLSNKFILNPINFEIPFESRDYKAIFLDKKTEKLTPNKMALIDYSSRFGFSGEEDGQPNFSFPTDGNETNQNQYLDRIKLDFPSFTINKNGIKYTFNEIELRETRTIPLTLRYLQAFNIVTYDPTYNLSISDWKLGTIQDSKTNRTVHFEYEEYQRNEVIPTINQKDRVPGVENGDCFFDFFYI